MTKYTAIITIKTADNHLVEMNLPGSYFTFNGAVNNARRMVNCVSATQRIYRNAKIQTIDVYATKKGNTSLAGFTLC